MLHLWIYKLKPEKNAKSVPVFSIDLNDFYRFWIGLSKTFPRREIHSSLHFKHSHYKSKSNFIFLSAGSSLKAALSRVASQLLILASRHIPCSFTAFTTCVVIHHIQHVLMTSNSLFFINLDPIYNVWRRLLRMYLNKGKR